MKRDRKNIGKALLEGLGEIALTLGCLVLGAAIVSLFGGDVNFSETDPDLLILLGIVVFFVVFFLAYTLIQRIKKKSRSNKTTNQEEEKNEK